MSAPDRNEPAERELVRLLTGELDFAATDRLTQRLSRDEMLKARQREITTTWQRLELPPAAPVPADFADRVVASAIESAVFPSLSASPAWVRGLAALSLGLGLLLGAMLGRGGSARPDSAGDDFELLGRGGLVFEGFGEEAL